MAVVMLTEGCQCRNQALYQHLINNVDKSQFCGCYVEPPLLSGKFSDWLRNNVCPACWRIIDNIGETLVNLTTTAGNFVVATVDAAGNIVSGVGTGVSGFVANPQNIPCATGAVAAAFGQPMGLGGCTPQGFNEQNMPPAQAPSMLSNPIILGGLGLAAYLLLSKK